MKKYWLIFLGVSVFTSCSNSKNGAGSVGNAPSCLRKLIDRIENKQYENPPIQIDEYNYKGQRVFLYTADCCDQYNVAYDENCNAICAPSGGLTGSGDRKCIDFKDSAKLVRMIWKKKS